MYGMRDGNEAHPYLPFSDPMGGYDRMPALIKLQDS